MGLDNYFDKGNVTMVDKKTCAGCVYLSYMGGGYGVWCDYIGYEGRSRSCPAGKGCTEKRQPKGREFI